MLPVGLILFRNYPATYGVLPDFGRTGGAPSALDIKGVTLAARRGRP